MKSLMKIGVALYGDGTPFGREGNVACEYRGQPFEFVSATDLPGQTLWITNCSLSGLIEAGLHKNPKIAHEGYFRTRLAQIAQELGLNKLSLNQQSSLLAEILGNAAEMGRIQLGFTQYPSKGLAQIVGQMYGAMEAPQGSAIYQVAEQACQRYTACERERRHAKADVFNFWMPRFAWAETMLGQPLPVDGDLKAIPLHALPGMGRDPIALVEWATENSLPLFARIRVNGLEQTVGKLMNYGAGAQDLQGEAGDGRARFSARNMREWCALPELDVLTQSGDVEIKQVAIAAGWDHRGLHAYSSKLSSVSYAYGLVCENLWTGLTRKPDQSGSVSRSLSTAWLQAVDRMQCLRVAERIYKLGMEIINYGNGRITVVCPPAVRALVPQTALEEGLLFPASLEGLAPVRVQADNPDHVHQHLISSQDFARIISVDQATLREMETRANAA